MQDCQNGFADDSWKSDLHSALVISMVGDRQERDGACGQIGRYYQCIAPASLYKYYSDDPDRIENTVFSNKMWYSAPVNFNDIFDCDAYIDTEGIVGSAVKLESNGFEIRRNSPLWRRIEQGIEPQIETLRMVFNNYRYNMGIACLTESDYSLLMWAHYASCHRGICVEYELMDICNQLHFTPVPVIYTDNKACFNSLGETQKDVERNALSVFTESLVSKSPEWSYEKEWRIIRDQNACGDRWDETKRGALLDMVQPISITVGCAATAAFEEQIRGNCRERGIRLYKMEKDPTNFRLNKRIILK